MNYNKKKGISIYYQLEEYIKEKIVSQEWPKGHKIPSEMELAKFFKVSRSTVRHAISNLVADGILVRKQGLGTYVTKPSFEGNFVKFYFPSQFGSFHKLLDIKKVEASYSISEFLGLPSGSIVTEISRLRYIGDDTEASILEKSYYDSKLLPDLENEDLSDRIYDTIEKKYNINLIEAKTLIEPVLLRDKEAKGLNSSLGSPVLLLSRVCYTYNEKPVILTKSLVLADKCKLLIKD